MIAVLRDGVLYGALGAFGSLLTILVSVLIHPIAAIALLVALLMGLTTVVYPFLGLFLLAIFAHLDGLSNVIFAPSPVSGFKLLSASTCLGVAMTLVLLRDHVRQTLRDPVFVMAVLFIVTMGISSLFATNFEYAADSIRRMVSLFVFLFLCIYLIDRRERLGIIIYVVMGTSLFSATVLIMDIALGTSLLTSTDAATSARTAEGFDRSSGGSEHNPTTAATMLLAGVIMALVAFLEGGKHRKFYFAVVAVGTLGILLSFARSSALVYAVIVLLLAVRYRKSRYLPLGIILGFISLMAMTPFVPPSYWERITSIFGGGGGDWTLGRRLTYNVIGLELAFRFPVLGVGPGNFKAWFVEPEFRHLPGRTLLGRQLHNMYLSVIVEYGIIGATFFFGFIFHSLRSVRRAMLAPTDEDMRVMATAFYYGFLAYLMVSVFVPNEYNKYTWMLAGVGSAFAYLNRPANGRTASTQSNLGSLSDVSKRQRLDSLLGARP